MNTVATLKMGIESVSKAKVTIERVRDRDKYAVTLRSDPFAAGCEVSSETIASALTLNAVGTLAAVIGTTLQARLDKAIAADLAEREAAVLNEITRTIWVTPGRPVRDLPPPPSALSTVMGKTQ